METLAEKMHARIVELLGALRRIDEICHVPSKGRHAYTHFMADFDEIRTICKDHLG